MYGVNSSIVTTEAQMRLGRNSVEAFFKDFTMLDFQQVMFTFTTMIIQPEALVLTNPVSKVAILAHQPSSWLVQRQH